MPKAHKRTRKLPVTVIDHRQPHATTSTASSSKPAATRTVIRRFHVLIKRKAQLEKAIRQGEASVDGGDPRAALRDVEQEIEELGGLGAYQRMSSIGQGSDRGGGSERVLIDWLKELGAHGTAKEAKKRLQYVRRCTPVFYSNPMVVVRTAGYLKWEHCYQITTRPARAGLRTPPLTFARGTRRSGSRISSSWMRMRTARSGTLSASAL